MSISNEQPVDTAFSLAMGVGMNLAAELVATFGPTMALERLGNTARDTFTPSEMAILGEAFQRIMQGRVPAPDDLSALGEVEVPPCADPSCLVCLNGGAA
ncbi:hypothetical protein ACFYOK_10890 [Microbispora bryophytorum]|uniref:hypothetical protein n=1 Tax=Microbispora bryophytorum TaxID=1460882 RepID=UPI0033DD740C